MPKSCKISILYSISGKTERNSSNLPQQGDFEGIYYIYLTMNFDEEIVDKNKVEYEHHKRVKEQMTAEEEAIKAARLIRGADTKNYKKFKKGKYIRPPKQELSDEMKLTLARRYQALTGFMGIASIVITFFIIYDSPLHLSILENFIIVLKVYNSTLLLSIFKNYLVIKINLILLGCASVAANIAGVINFQHKHDKISDRISTGQSRIGTRRVSRKYQGLIRFMGIAGVGIILLSMYCSRQHISIFESFIVVLSIHDSSLHLSIFESIVIEMNLVLLGCALAAASVGIIGFRQYKRNKINNRINAG